MKLAGIQIDRCGVWRDLSLPLDDSGLSVLYGPNEAGKSTLAQFIGSVLYGFPVEDSNDTLGSSRADGALLLEAGADRHSVHRSAAGAARGIATIAAEGESRPADEFLKQALQGIDEHAYRTLFAVDLQQLQELGTLSGDEAAARIYDVALGREGQRLLAAGSRAQAARSRLVDPLQQDGELVRLFERHDQLTAEFRGLERQRRQHVEWCQQRDQVESGIADLRQRQSGIREQLRGHLYLQRAWGPWQAARAARRELAEIPDRGEFPEQGIERLDRIETDLAAAAEARDRLLSEARKHRAACQQTSTTGRAWARAGVIQGFVEQRAWILALQEQREGTREVVEESANALGTAIERLGPEWNAERVRSLDLSPAGWQRVSGTAQSLRSALGRRHALVRGGRRLVAACRELQDSLRECLHDLSGESVETALSAARERLKRMNHLARLQVREAELNQRQFSLVEHRERILPQLSLPRWVYIVLGVFCFMGIVLAGWGLLAGVYQSGIVGAIYAMLGITCGGLAWGLKAQYEGDARRRMEEADAQLAGTLAELRDVRKSIEDLTAEASAAAQDGSASPPDASLDGGELVRRAAERVAELVDLSQHQRNLRSLRRRLEQNRQKLKVARREVATVRDTWSELLNENGLPETLSAGEALDTWQQLLEAGEALTRHDHARTAADSVESLWNSCRQKIAEVGRRIGCDEVDYEQPLAVLDVWETQLGEFARLRRDRASQKKKYRACRRQAAAHQQRVDEFKTERDALLAQVGATSRDEFEEFARQAERRGELLEQCAAAESELEALGSEHTDLALVEEDLLAFDAQQNVRCIETLEREAADLEQDLYQSLEDLGGIKQEIRQIEEDRRPASLRFELEQVRSRLQAAARDWAVIELAAQASDDVRHDFERRHQPETLQAASGFLTRLTQGRYTAVWTPLGERRLMVDDDHGRSLPVSALSRGTREQLFLAVRLAVVDHLACQGITLPLIFDDVFVNFDEHRAEAAADVLCEFSRSGHQVLFFTCHLHLARIFQDKGIKPIWLPDHRSEQESREGQRRAG